MRVGLDSKTSLFTLSPPYIASNLPLSYSASPLIVILNYAGFEINATTAISNCEKL